MSNKKKQKQKIRQKRQMKRGQKKKVREKRVLKTKRTGQKKPALQKVTDMKSVPSKVKIRFYIYKAIRKLRRLGCLIGFHDWKLCSGKEGDSKFTCIKCWKGSKIKWGLGGSTEHYDKKMKEQKEVSNPKNWEKKEGKYYFKGKYVNLKEEEVRRLEIILGPKHKEVKK